MRQSGHYLKHLNGEQFALSWNFEHWSRGCNSFIHSCLTVQRMAANRTAATANEKEIFT